MKPELFKARPHDFVNVAGEHRPGREALYCLTCGDITWQEEKFRRWAIAEMKCSVCGRVREILKTGI